MSSQKKRQYNKRTKSVSILPLPIIDEGKTSSCFQPINQTFLFISTEFSKYLTCTLCKNLMIKPMRFHPCGHTFCQKCIEPLKECQDKVCPEAYCSRKCTIIQPDRTAESLIDELKVECTNQGCVWKGCYSNYKLTHKESCPLKKGLNNWLEQLTKGIIVKNTKKLADQNNEDSNNMHGNQNIEDQEKVQYREYEENSNLKKVHENEEQIKDSSNSNVLPLKVSDLSINPEKLSDRKISEPDIQNSSLRQNQETTNEYNLQSELIKIEKKQNTEKQEKQEDQIKLRQNQFMKNQTISRFMSNNRSILNLPFGSSIQQQMNKVISESDEFRKKQLKRYHG